MTNQEITEAIVTLRQTSAQLEDAYIDNGGEMTADTERLENEKAALRDLLTTDGVDTLGRWLKSKEDEAKTIKAEADYITRRRKAVENSVEYVKARIAEVLAATGTDKVKGGNGYSFTATESVDTTVDRDALREAWLGIVEAAARAAGLPAFINVELKVSTSAAAQCDELPGYVTRTRRPSVTFRKPRANKEDAQ
jgi:hypothetical protein